MSRYKGRSLPQLKRRAASREPRKKLIVVCEGKLTEPEYFHEMARHYRALVNLVLEKGAGVPLSVVEKALKIARSHSDSKGFESGDQVWAVFDRDEHPHFEQAIAMAHEGGIHVAYSNPCFELWLVLHYQDYDRPVHRREIQKALCALMPGYDPSSSKRVKFGAICDFIEKAEQRAQTLERRRAEERDPKGNPSTSVFRLAQQIRSPDKF
jgi:RloB-like protein